MKSYNQEFHRLFNEIADLLAILGENAFKIIAYRRAARNISESLDPIVKRGADPKKFMQIPGIGKAIAEKMTEYLKTGKIRHLEELRKQVPKTVRDMLGIPGLGPGRVRKLFLNLGIRNKNDLLKAAANGDIAELPGFGDKLIEQILTGMEKGQKKKKRHARAEVKVIAETITGLLRKVRGVARAEVAGSYRRGKKTVGDLDILVSGKGKASPVTAKRIKQKFPDIRILAEGETKFSFVIFPENLQVDIRFVPPESWGAALLYFTGNKDFNVEMRKIAISRNYLLNEYGLFEDGEYIAGKTEKEVFEKLGMKYLKPEKRI